MGLIGVIPSVDKTFEVYGDINSDELIEGKLYHDTADGKLYYYSTKLTRSSPANGYFPIWDGKHKIVTSFSKDRYMKDVILTDINYISNTLDKTMADRIIYQQRKSCSSDTLQPPIVDGDNMFTQCIKGTISALNVTMIDLIDMASPKINPKIIDGYYGSLSKITFMRYDKWMIWVNDILHINYELTVFKSDKKILVYEYPKDKFDTGIVKYDNIISTTDDPFKKIVKILMVMENITKRTLRTDAMDDYTINNMMTTLSSNKPLSAQLFSRFIRMAKLSCNMKIYHKGEMVFEYNE